MFNEKEYTVTLNKDSFDKAVEIFNKYLDSKNYFKFLGDMEDFCMEEKFQMISKLHHAINHAKSKKVEAEEIELSVVFSEDTNSIVVSYNK